LPKENGSQFCLDVRMLCICKLLRRISSQTHIRNDAIHQMQVFSNRPTSNTAHTSTVANLYTTSSLLLLQNIVLSIIR